MKSKVLKAVPVMVAALAANPAVAAESACTIKLGDITFNKCLNDADKKTTISKDTITIQSGAKQDYFNDPNGKLSNNTAPVILTSVDNTKPFTLTAKVTPQFRKTYDAGALYLFLSDQLWQKFAFELDDYGATRVVSVRTDGTSDDNNHQSISAKAVYLKMSSDTKTLGLYYSTDNKRWNLARLYKNSYPATIWLGLSAQSPLGDGSATTFGNISLTTQSVKDFRLGI